MATIIKTQTLLEFLNSMNLKTKDILYSSVSFNKLVLVSSYRGHYLPKYGNPERPTSSFIPIDEYCNLPTGVCIAKKYYKELTVKTIQGRHCIYRRIHIPHRIMKEILHM